MATQTTSNRQRHIVMFASPKRWPCYPFLPVKRRTDNGDQLGLLYDAIGVSRTYGYKATVFLANLFGLPKTEDELLALPKCVYDIFEELVDDGWIVD